MHTTTRQVYDTVANRPTTTTDTAKVMVNNNGAKYESNNLDETYTSIVVAGSDLRTMLVKSSHCESDMPFIG
jgi:hypothetical protein